MSTTLEEQIKQLKRTIAEMESQRAVLGDAAVEAALLPFRQKLEDLEAQLEPQVEEQVTLPKQQRKLITMLFVDVVGSTEMTRHLDPEDTLTIMDGALRRLAEPVASHGGHVTRYMGDGFKSIFGDPHAREDDPEQAIRAGLDILEVSQTIAQELDNQWGIQNFQVRIGVNTGLVALGGFTEAQDTIMGSAVNLAARLESAAPPGGLLISHDTYRHVRGVFDVQAQEQIKVKGFAEPVSVYLVQRARPRAFRVPLLGVEGIETRMVGRHDELKFLQDALITANEEGEGHVVTVTGEAGVGKSRLLYEFQNWIELQPQLEVILFQGRGRHETQGQPYRLLRDLFDFRFQILDDDSGERARRKMEAGFKDVLDSGGDALMRTHFIGQLIGFDFSASPHLKDVLNDPEQLRNRGLIYLKEYFQVLAEESPIVVFLEDIHWADDSSLDMLNRLGEITPRTRLLIVCAARNTLFERRPFWSEGQVYHTCLELRPLSKRESRLLVTEILRLVEIIPSRLRELIVEGAEGNPFYVEELIKMLIEDDVIIPGDETWRVEQKVLELIDVPATLTGVLQARLESLPGYEQKVLKQASVVGRLFWDRLVAHIQAEGGEDGDPQLVPLALAALRGRELIYRREDSAFTGTAEYLFKHDVLREVTYESVLKRLRKTYHGLVGDWLIANSGDRIAEYSGLIAQHLLLAGRKVQACEYLIRAGESALASFANSEAERYFRQALELLPSNSLRAELLYGLGKALQRQGRSRFDEAEKSYRQAINLYQELGEMDRLADAYTHLSWLLWDLDQQRAWKLCQEGLENLAGAPDSPGYARLLAEAGRTDFYISASDQVLPLCQRAQEMAARVGDLQVGSEARITLALQLDDPQEGIKILKQVVAETEAHRILRTAARVNLNLGYYFNLYLIDLASAHQHYLRAAQIYKQMGDNERMKYTLTEVYRCLVYLGELNAVESIVADFLRGSTVPESEVNEFFSELSCLYHARGDWHKSLQLRRALLAKLHQGSSIFRISWHNLWLADTFLELNRFVSHDDLSEAELVLKENIEFNWLAMRSRYKLAVISARQGRCTQARDWLEQAKNDMSPPGNNLEQELCRGAEFEIALAEGRRREAVASAEASLEILQNCGQRWRWARRLIDLGDALAGRDEPGDLERAQEAYQQSLDTFSEMGAPGYMQVVEKRLEDLQDLI